MEGKLYSTPLCLTSSLLQMEQSISMSISSSFTPTSSLSKDPHASASWSRVSPNYHGYRLGSLFRHRHEIEHFMSFLQNKEARWAVFFFFYQTDQLFKPFKNLGICIQYNQSCVSDIMVYNIFSPVCSTCSTVCSASKAVVPHALLMFLKLILINGFVCVHFRSVFTWRAGWTWSVTGGFLRRTKPSDERSRLRSPQNTSTGSTSLAPTAPPPKINRMMYVSQWFHLKTICSVLCLHMLLLVFS